MPPQDPKRAWLEQHWVHSHEEDTDDEMVFRPASFRFPPSRGRRTLDLRADGTLGGSRPGPSDKPQSTEGRWEMAGKALRVHAPGAAPQEMPVVSLSADRLVLKKS